MIISCIAIINLSIARKDSLRLAPFVILILTCIITANVSFNTLLILLTFFISCYCYFKKNLPAIVKTVLWIEIFLITWALGLHKIFNIQNFQLFSQENISIDSYPYDLWFNIDSVFAIGGLAAFSMKPLNLRNLFKNFNLHTVFLCFAAIATTMLVAISLNLVELDLKIPHFWSWWLIINLLITCAYEEVFFRFFIQGTLSQLLKKYSCGDFLALITSSSLFTLKHFPCPISYLAVVFIASLFYSYLFMRTNKLSLTVSLHFIINCIHFFAFSYPMLIAK